MMRIYAGNLPRSVDDDALANLFSPFGDVASAGVVLDRETGQSRCFGFVEMGEDAARAAIGGLNGSEFAGQRLIINEARPRT
ncbi:MAG: RNA-binding protein [Planctomycetota bacterium]